jgi:hypothetical protein
LIECSAGHGLWAPRIVHACSITVEVRIWCEWEEVVGVKAHHRADTRRSDCEIHNDTGIVSRNWQT